MLPPIENRDPGDETDEEDEDCARTEIRSRGFPFAQSP
jgi:hypothetical protein